MRRERKITIEQSEGLKADAIADQVGDVAAADC
jgi:hypothetical protein